MKSKEEILKNYGQAYEYDYSLNVCPLSAAQDAMSEYAKEVAIEFAWWIIDHRLDFQPATPDGMYIGVNMEKYNQHELYEQFKAEKGL